MVKSCFVWFNISSANLTFPLAGEGLVYSKEDTSFKAMEKKWTIQAPVNGFLFPSFHDGGSDIHSLLYYSKKELHAEFITYGLECGLPLSEKDQQEYFSAAIAEAFPDNYTLDTAAQVYQKVQEYICLLYTSPLYRPISPPLSFGRIE